MKVAIGVPIINRSVDSDFFLSFAAMQKPQHYTLLAPSFENYGFREDIAKIRNGLVVQAIESKVDALIMLDTDQVYPANTIAKLLGNLSWFDAVGAVVHRRYPPFNPLLLRGRLGAYTRVPDEQCYSGELIEIDATGCGCIAYNMRVFERINYPWFELKPDANNNNKPVGEDIRFCHRMKSVGFSIGADTSIQVDHLTTFRVDRATHELFKLTKENNNGNLQERQRL